MDVRQLRYFVGVLEAKSLTKAATQLNISQPALGVSIRNLERELGVKLVHRQARGVTPTEAGARLARQTGSLLEQFDRLRQDLADYNTINPTGALRLCVSRNMPRIVTAAIAERCRNAFPDLELKIVVGWQKPSSGPSKESEADLVLTFRPHSEIYFASEPLVRDELLFVHSANGRRMPREVSFCSVVQRILILPGEPHYIRCLVEAAARLTGRELKIYCDIDSIETAAEIVMRGRADTVLPVACIRQAIKEGILKTARIKDPKLERTLCLLRSSRRSRSNAIEPVAREIRAIILRFAQDDTFGWKRIVDGDLR